MSGVQFGDSGMPPGVKVVKLSATTSGIANARTVYSPQVRHFIKKAWPKHSGPENLKNSKPKNSWN